jgi:hypothetical protein
MDYREIQRLARDPASVRKIANVLLTVPGLSDRQIDFLSDMAEIKGGITTRQGEFLVGIRDDMQEVATYRDFNVARIEATIDTLINEFAEAWTHSQGIGHPKYGAP